MSYQHGFDGTRTDGGPADSATGPLGDLKVLDLTQMLAGPYATMLLADMGADVVKIEPPGGDSTRDNQPHLQEDEAYGGYFHSVNRNKRSIVLDLKTDEGKEAFLDLVSKADLLLENYRVGTMERLDLSYERLSEINPALIYASIRGFGDPRGGESPYVDRPAFDVIAQAMGGVMSVTGTEESGPIKVGPGIGDIFPAVLCTVGVLSALHHRERTGEGQYVDVGMVDSVLSLAERIVYQYSFTGDVPGPQGNTHPLLFPFDRFEANDGYVMIAAPRDHQWTELCNLMERPEWVEEYPSASDRLDNASKLRPIINDWTQEYSKDELFDLLEDDVPCGPVNTVKDIFEDEHFDARDMLAEVEHADTGDTVRIAGNPIKFTETPSTIENRAPFLGEHTREVLQENGFDEDQIASMLDREGAKEYRSE